ncbi:hypothetical protein [Paraburkholderia sp. SIMBA_027]|uniref:hypothetical protein n=1 Tax=Paraburkholderia sp. SIMBA_027 TaxID=3085770 RepID=UPI003978277D
MPASKKTTEATADDLAWFELDKYASLSPFTALDWARLVGDRLAIRRAIDGKIPESVADVFELIKDEPLKWLGSDVRYTGAKHAANTATVKSLNLNRLRRLADEATVSLGSEGGDAVVDQLLARNPESAFRRYAHVMVSIDAPRDQIVDDFARWLDGWLASFTSLPDTDFQNGDYMDKARNRWIPLRAVQWYDLDLFERMTGKSVPSVFRWSRLFPNVDAEALESKKKGARNAAAQLFSYDTLTVLRSMAHA